MNTQLSPEAHLTIQPRGLSLAHAAQYIGVGPALFLALMKMGRMPQPKLIGPRLVWDRLDIDVAFDALPPELEVPPPRPAAQQPTTERPAPITVRRPTKEEIAAVKLKMDMARYGQSTEGMTDAQIDKLDAELHKRWVKKVRASPLNKREKAALPRLYELRHQSVVRHGEIKGTGWSTEDSLEARGYATLTKYNDLTVSWRITEEGIRAVEAGLAN